MNTNHAMLCASAVSGAAAWTPASLSNKVGWWRASDITGKSDGDSVTAWPDSFGLLSDATGSGTYRTGANGIGGQPAIEFNGLGNEFDTGATNQFTDFFTCVVAKPGTANFFYRRFLDKDYQNGFLVSWRTSSRVQAGLFSALDNTVTVSNTEIYIFFGRNGSNAILDSDTFSRTDACSTTATSTAHLHIGNDLASGTTSSLEGKISEVIVLSAYPSAEDLNNLRAYITDTYGITTS